MYGAYKTPSVPTRPHTPLEACFLCFNLISGTSCDGLSCQRFSPAKVIVGFQLAQKIICDTFVRYLQNKLRTFTYFLEPQQCSFLGQIWSSHRNSYTLKLIWKYHSSGIIHWTHSESHMTHWASF